MAPQIASGGQGMKEYIIEVPDELASEIELFCATGEIDPSDFFKMASEYFLRGIVGEEDRTV
jgi:hypothetical protein